GALAGLRGDGWNLGFVVETERQVEAHLDEHLRDLPEADLRSRAILETMKADEARHAANAEQAGARVLPPPLPTLMAGASALMKKVAYRVSALIRPLRGHLLPQAGEGSRSFDQVAAVVELFDLALEPRLDLHPLLERQVAGALLEQVVVEVEVLQVHLRVEDVFLVDVDVEHLVARADVLGQVVLDRIDLVVDVVLATLDVTGEAAHAVVHDHDVGLQRLDQVVQRLQRR